MVNITVIIYSVYNVIWFIREESQFALVYPMAMYDLQHVVLLLEYALYTCAQLVDAREWNFKVKAFSDLIDCRVKNIMKFIMVMKERITLQSLVNHNVWSVYCQISSIWKFFGSGFFFYFCLIWRRISKQYFFFHLKLNVRKIERSGWHFKFEWVKPKMALNCYVL